MFNSAERDIHRFHFKYVTSLEKTFDNQYPGNQPNVTDFWMTYLGFWNHRYVL